MDLATQLTKPEIANMLSGLTVKTMTNEHYLALQPLSQLPVVMGEQATDDEILEILKYLASALSYRSVDDETGRMKVAVYVSKLKGFTKEALQYASNRVLDDPEIRFLPTVAEIAKIAKQFEPDAKGAKERITSLCRQYKQAEFDEIFRRMKFGEIDNDEINSLSDRMKRIGDDRGLIRLVNDRYELRETIWNDGSMDKPSGS